LIATVARLLGLRAELVKSSTLGVELTKADRLIEICRRLGADTYLSGHGAKKYQDEAQFHAQGLRLFYSDFAPSPYRQLWGDFLPGLSVLDALFNLGRDGTAAL